jgi:hypothetical protein
MNAMHIMKLRAGEPGDDRWRRWGASPHCHRSAAVPSRSSTGHARPPECSEAHPSRVCCGWGQPRSDQVPTAKSGGSVKMRPRRWRSAGFAVCWATLGLLLAGGFPTAAQEPDAAADTNEISAAEVLAQISEMVQAAESGQAEDMTGPNGLPATNDLSQASAPPQSSNRTDRGSGSNSSQGSSPFQNDDRRSRSRRSSRSKSDQGSSSRSGSDFNRGGDRTRASALEGTNSSIVGLDYSAFKLIVDRNIFDPNRYPRRPNEPRVRSAPKPFDSLTLVGTMSYEKGAFAFFDGSSTEYKKALKLSDVIAGYKVTNIAPNGVTLAAGTNALELSVGMQLRREEDGPWLLSGRSGSYAATPAPTATNALAATTATTGSETGSGAAESDVIKRLMQKRQQE